jgi:TonB family protein
MKEEGMEMTRTVVTLCILILLAGCQSEPQDSATVYAGDVRQAPASDSFSRFDTPPVLVNYVPPVYPEEARSQGLEGEVDVKLVVGTDGRVEEASVLGGSAPQALQNAALESARKCRFKPASLEGKAVRCTVVVPFHYALGERKHDD